MTRWLERLVALAVVALLTWPLILLFATYPTLLPICIAAFGGLIVGGYLGYGVGRTSAEYLCRLRNEELDTEWRQLFKELDADHTDELASRDATIYLLRRDNKAEFLNGQQFRTDREEHGLG